jgi:PAS domain S-box-containing protein
MEKEKLRNHFPVLIAEDDRSSRLILERSLSTAGYKVTSVENGRKALELFKTKHFPIVVTDWIMPELNGLELCRAIRKKAGRNYVFIILLTARDSKKDILTGLEAGVDDYLSKPFEKLELLARMDTGVRLLQLEKFLRESRKYTENIISSMASSLIVIKPNQTISLVNRATCNLLGYSQKELLKLSIDDIISDDLSPEKSLFEQLVEKGSTKSFEISYKAKSGEKIPVSFTSSVMQSRGGNLGLTSGLICVAVDISHRKQAEKRLLKVLEELQEAKDMVVQSEKLAAIGRFSAGVAHEILNPANILSIRIQLLEMTENLSDEGKAAVEICKAQVKRISEITRKLGQFSRKSESHVSLYDINKIIIRILALCAPQFKMENIDFKTKYSPNLPLTSVDKDKLDQVFFNIISNASAAMAEQKTKRLTITTLPADGEYVVRIIISDTGAGIPPENIYKIFDPFFTTKGPDQGTGLGLFISYKMIEEMDGKIWVENNVADGVSFMLKLPGAGPRRNGTNAVQTLSNQLSAIP